MTVTSPDHSSHSNRTSPLSSPRFLKLVGALCISQIPSLPPFCLVFGEDDEMSPTAQFSPVEQWVPSVGQLVTDVP